MLRAGPVCAWEADYVTVMLLRTSPDLWPQGGCREELDEATGMSCYVSHNSRGGVHIEHVHKCFLSYNLRVNSDQLSVVVLHRSFLSAAYCWRVFVQSSFHFAFVNVTSPAPFLSRSSTSAHSHLCTCASSEAHAGLYLCLCAGDSRGRSLPLQMLSSGSFVLFLWRWCQPTWEHFLKFDTNATVVLVLHLLPSSFT